MGSQFLLIAMRLEVLLDLLGSSDKLFPTVLLSRCRRANTLQALQRLSEVKTMLRLFQDVQLSARLGFNLGTGDISFTSAPSYDHLPSVFTVDEYEGDLSQAQKQQLIMWIMLGIAPCQSDLERSYTQNNPSKESLANQCLE